MQEKAPLRGIPDRACRGLTKSGHRCRNRASANGYCHVHGGYSVGETAVFRRNPALMPDDVKENQRERKELWDKSVEEDPSFYHIFIALVILFVLAALGYEAFLDAVF